MKTGKRYEHPILGPCTVISVEENVNAVYPTLDGRAHRLIGTVITVRFEKTGRPFSFEARHLPVFKALEGAG